VFIRETNRSIKWLGIRRNMRIVDVGCGVGLHSIAFAEMGYEVLGLDFSKEMLKEAKQNERRRFGAAKIHFVLASAKYLPVKTMIFDAA